MARIEVSRPVAADAATTWRTVSDWSRHGSWIPFTTMELHGTSPGVGDEFTATTGVGRLALVDRMRVEQWSPPTATAAGSCLVRKAGPTVRGSAGFTVSPVSETSCTLVWWESVSIGPAWLGPLADLITLTIGRLGFWYSVGRMAKDCARRPTAQH